MYSVCTKFNIVGIWWKMVVYLKLNKENLFDNDCKVTFYTIFLIAKLSSLSRNSQLTVFSLTSRNSLRSLWLLKTHCLFSLSAQKFVIHTHKRIYTLNILNASHEQSQVLGLTFSTVFYGTPIGYICNCWAPEKEIWTPSQNLPIPQHALIFLSIAAAFLGYVFTMWSNIILRSNSNSLSDKGGDRHSSRGNDRGIVGQSCRVSLVRSWTSFEKSRGLNRRRRLEVGV